VDEELALLGFYERKIAPIFKHWKLPPYVVVRLQSFFTISVLSLKILPISTIPDLISVLFPMTD